MFTYCDFNYRKLSKPQLYLYMCVGVCRYGGKKKVIYLVQPTDSWIPPRLNLFLQPRPQPEPALLLHALVCASGEWKRWSVQKQEFQQ